MKEETIELTDMQIDALREIANIGAGHAADSLSRMIKRKVMLKVPSVNIVKLEEAPKVICCEKEEMVDGVYFKLTGELIGRSLIVFSNKSANLLFDSISVNEIGPTKIIPEEIKKSALMELGNIIAGSYITTLVTMTRLETLQSIPYFSSGPIGAIFNSVLAEVGLTSEIALVLEIELLVASEKYRVWFYVLPDMTSSTKILDALGVK